MTNSRFVAVPSPVDNVRLPPTPESHKVPLSDPQRLGEIQTPGSTPLSHPTLASSTQDLSREARSTPPQSKPSNVGGKGTPSLHTKVSEGKRTSGAEGVEESRLNPTPGHGLPVSSSVERKVSLHCICYINKPTPLRGRMI